jgi:hypothetical protein
MAVGRRAIGVVPIALSILLGSVAAGCSTDPPLSRAEYRAAAQAICRATTGDTPPPPATDDPAELRAAGRRSVARQRAALEEIQSLDAPSRDERRVAAWLGVVRRTLDAADRSLDAQERGDLGAADEANARGVLLAARADELATRLQLTDCVAATT